MVVFQVPMVLNIYGSGRQFEVKSSTANDAP
jgi:hypothetical protein